MAKRIERKDYFNIYGPTTGDKLYLADTDLVIEIEKDAMEGQYGNESIAGGGKSCRDGMAQKPGVLAREDSLDLVITNMIIMDPILGIIKGDIGVRDGKIIGIGKAGNPDTMDITPGLIIGPETEIITGDPGMIATAGGIDVHTHFESPFQAYEALSNGLTTTIGGGCGSKTLSIESPGAFNLRHMIKSFENVPLNIGHLARGNSCLPESTVHQALSGCIGMKIHEDWAATPSVIKTCLQVADDMDFSVQIHTDTLNESGFLESTIEAIGNKTIHAYHAEGAGGGHAPDIIRVCSIPNILPSSTNPTNPYTINTIDEHLDMIFSAHHLNPNVPEDVAFADSRIRAETVAAEDVLHDLGAISMLGSDSQGMGRVGETVVRTWQLASKMKMQRGKLKEDSPNNDNFRVLRYLAKYTINPAITFGISDYVGSLEPGKLADIVIWRHTFFGTKPDMVLKSGFLVWGPIGDANSSVAMSEPVIYKPQYGGFGGCCNELAKVFVVKAAIENGLADGLGISGQKLLPVRGTRNLNKNDMVLNDYCPNIYVDPQTYQVFIDGELITCESAKVLPLTQKYYFR